MKYKKLIKKTWNIKSVDRSSTAKENMTVIPNNYSHKVLVD